MTREEVVNKIRVILNDLQPFDEAEVVEGDNLPNKPVKEYIEQCLDDAVRDVQLVAPVRLIVADDYMLTNSNTNRYARGTKEYGVVQLPSDYLRLSAVKLSGWSKYVTVAEQQNSPAYELQLHEGTMAGFINPRVFEVCEGGDVPNLMELYPLGKFMYYNLGRKVVGNLKYISGDKKLGGKHSVITEDLFSDELIEPVCYACAVRVLIFFGKDTKGIASLYEQSLSKLR